MSDEPFTNASFTDESGSGEPPVLPGNDGGKKGLIKRWSSLSGSRKFLIVAVIFSAIVVPTVKGYEYYQDQKTNKILKEVNAARLKALQIKNERSRQKRLVPNEFGTSPPDHQQQQMNNPQGFQGAYGQHTGYPEQQQPSVHPSPMGLQTQSHLRPFVDTQTNPSIGNDPVIARIEKMEEINTVSNAAMGKKIDDLESQVSGLADKVSRLERHETSLNRKISTVCVYPKGGGRAHGSPPMQEYMDSRQAENVPLFKGWRVIGASGNGAVLMDTEGRTHFVTQGSPLNGQRVDSIDTDVGVVKFSNGEMVREE